MNNINELLTAITIATLTALGGCSFSSNQPADAQYGTNPALPAPQKSLIPTVNVAEADPWPDDTMPVAANGMQVTEFARDLDHPRWLYELPNGDVLVAESNSPPRQGGGIRSFFMKLFMKKAGAVSTSADRITLLRDNDQDGIAETRSVLIDNLFSPFGMTLIEGTLYIANADGIVSVPYSTDVTRIDQQPTDFFALPGGLNHHWTKNIVASDNGETLYAAVGSNSNVGENGLEIEKGRAAIWKIKVASATGDVYASGLRNPVGMDFYQPSSTLYTVVNERDELGNDLVPDYLTSVSESDFYGWPWSYFGNNVDDRVTPTRPDMVEQARVPDYALGSHTASLGLDIVDGEGDGFNSKFGAGAFIGQHGSWNRKPRSGYKVVFVAFRDGRPYGKPIDVLTGFLDNDIARGRPVGVIVDQRGGLLVADDVGNRIWRVSVN